MNSKRKCKHCSDYKPAEKGLKVPAGWFCSTDHALAYVKTKQQQAHQKQLAKAKQTQAKIIKADNKRFRAKKEALKPASKWRSEAQANFNKYIRLRDLFEPCISCGLPREIVEADQGWKIGGCWDAGHFQTRGAKGQLRFILFNVYKQCKSCNGGSGKFSHKSDTVGKQYKLNLIAKIGVEKVEWLENNNDIDQRKNDIEYLKRIKKIFSKKARLYERRFRS